MEEEKGGQVWMGCPIAQSEGDAKVVGGRDVMGGELLRGERV